MRGPVASSATEHNEQELRREESLYQQEGVHASLYDCAVVPVSTGNENIRGWVSPDMTYADAVQTLMRTASVLVTPQECFMQRSFRRVSADDRIEPDTEEITLRARWRARGGTLAVIVWATSSKSRNKRAHGEHGNGGAQTSGCATPPIDMTILVTILQVLLQAAQQPDGAMAGGAPPPQGRSISGAKKAGSAMKTAIVTQKLQKKEQPQGKQETEPTTSRVRATRRSREDGDRARAESREPKPEQRRRLGGSPHPSAAAPRGEARGGARR